MRIVTMNELPTNYHQHVVIKSAVRSRFLEFSTALERTLARCTEMRKEYESEIIALREESVQRGFTGGFSLFFTQILALLNEYEKHQNRQHTIFLQHVVSSINDSLRDPIIVEHITRRLLDNCGQKKALSIVFPRGVTIKNTFQNLFFQYTDDNHITVHTDEGAIRFPSDALCKQWFNDGEKKMASGISTLDNLIPNALQKIAHELLNFSHPSHSTFSESHEE